MPGTPATQHPCFFVSDDGMSGEFDHDFRHERDELGDHPIYGISYSGWYLRCENCDHCQDDDDGGPSDDDFY